MKRSLGVAAIVSGAMIGLIATAVPAQAGTTVDEPSDCSVTSTVAFTNVTYHMTCSGRPATQQWQLWAWCNPRGADGGDSDHYGNIVTGNGTSTAGCAILGPQGYAALTFIDSYLHAPGRG